MKRVEVDWKGEKIKAWVGESRGVYWLHFDGRTFEQASSQKDSSRKAKSQAGGNEVKAPMPGKVIKVTAKPGQSVKTGQVLVVMEAMKMEYNLKSPRDGVVETVSCNEGQQVQLNQSLVVLKGEA